MKLLVTVALVVTLLVLGLNIWQFLDGLDAAIGQEKWFSEGTRDILRGAIGAVIGIVAYNVLVDWRRALSK